MVETTRHKLRSALLQGALILLALMAMQAYQTRSHPSGPAPRANATLLSGERVELGASRAEPVMLHFWATWCGVCRLEEGSIDALAKGGRVITVASRSGSAASVQAYMRERGLTFPVVVDESGSVAARYGVHAYPSTFFLRRDGEIERSVVGYTTTLGLKLRLWWAGL